jgi:hypothetical protein
MRIPLLAMTHTIDTAVFDAAIKYILFIFDIHNQRVDILCSLISCIQI